MKWWDFNLAESRGIFILLFLLLIGSGIGIYKRYHAAFSTEMVFREALVEFEKSKSTKRASHDQDKATPAISAKRINLNAASRAELESLPYIGPTLSRRIIEYREKNGNFQKADDLLKVKGIGRKTLERIRDYLELK